MGKMGWQGSAVVSKVCVMKRYPLQMSSCGCRVCLLFTSSCATLVDMHRFPFTISLKARPKNPAHFERYMSGIFDRNYNPSL